MNKKKSMVSLKNLIFFLLLIFISCSTNIPRETSKTTSPKKLSREIAKNIVIEDIIKPSKAPYGLRAYMYPNTLTKESMIVPFESWNKGEREFMSCSGQCWFFWIDDNPLAQFAHETRYVLIDSLTGKIEIKNAEWWPVIKGKSMWGKTDERMKDEYLIFSIPSKLEESIYKEHKFNLKEIQAAPGCEAWVILICGSTDSGNTFDEDVQFLYNTFTTLGYNDAHIFYISPWTTDAGVDRTTTIANVQWAINQVAINSDVEDKVFFFYSSHGGIDFLHCCPGEPGGGNVTSVDMDNWLDTITSRDLEILLQGCHTGSFIGYYSNGTVVASENELTGDRETNRIAMTATDTDHSSYGGSSTWGSTFTGGYVESFNDVTADVVNDGKISVDEAYSYALANDNAANSGWSFPHMDPTSLDPKTIFHVCPNVDLWISDGPNDIGNNSYDYNSVDIWSSLSATGSTHENPVSGLTNYVHVRVHNLGNSIVYNAQVTLYWANTSSALAWPADFHQIGTTFTFSSISPGGEMEHTWQWYVDPALGTGHHFCFVATTECLDDPIVGGPSGCTYVAPYDNNIAQKNITIVEAQAGQSVKVKFLIENNLRRKIKFDLLINRENFPNGQVILSLPDDIARIVKNDVDSLQGIKPSESKEQGKLDFLITNEKKAMIRQIDLKPMEAREATIEITVPKNAKLGQEFTLRIEELLNGEIIGANTFLVRVVPQNDCRLILKKLVESFGQIAFWYQNETSFMLVKKLGDVLRGELCKDRVLALKINGELLEMENKIGEELKDFIPSNLFESYSKQTTIINKALKKENLEETLKSQAEILKILEEIVSQKKKLK